MHSKMFSTATFAIAASTLFTAVNGHMFISEPKPIEGSAPKDPLDASGSNFPCHGVTLPGSGGQQMAAGSKQQLQFELGGGANTAVHGGGSCQISITYETDPAKIKDPANWRVIHSIEGGCPTNSFQNLDGSYQGPSGTYSGAIACSDPKSNGVDCVNAFEFEIPKDLTSGQGTLAWTWFNSVGNREMYMNCVAVDITGGAKDSEFVNKLPQMFVANLASVNQCPTTQSVNVKFPNPGASLETKTAEPKYGQADQYKTFPTAEPSGSGCSDNKGGNAAPPAGGNSDPSPAKPNPGGVFAPGAGGGSGGAQPTSTSMVTQVVTTTPPPSTGGSSGGSGDAPPAPAAGGALPQGQACTTPGEIICIGSDQWAMCANGIAQPMALAAGTSCKDGKISKREVTSPKAAVRRHVHNPHHRRQMLGGGSF